LQVVVRRILANLLCEDELARAFGPLRRGAAAPTRRVLATVSPLATRLAVFGREGDRLWTPAPVAPDEVFTAPGLPPLILESGPLRELPPADEVLAWCETPAAAAHRSRPRDPGAFSREAPLYERLWLLPVPEPSAVAAVHHRAFHLQIAEELGCALPGARMVSSLAELDRALRNAPPSWVVKAPLSASGRERYIGQGGRALSDPKARRTVERLLERHGALLFEPWMERTEDFGVSALLAGSELRIVGLHRQRVDSRGRFAGIDLASGPAGEDRDRLLETAEAVAQALRAAGYAGPFGIDAWKYRRSDGAVILNPLGEINARMTFGLVEWALAEAFAPHSPNPSLPEGERGTRKSGRGDPL
jgi:hypothetical protein